jgi:hypothetical protein
VLRAIEANLGDQALLINMHHLCEQAMMVLASRDDVEDLAEEVGKIEISTPRQADIEKIVGRKYQEFEWYALDLEPSDKRVAERFRWNGDQCLVPHFRLQYRGTSYSTIDMGLGEFSVHFLFWILELYRDEKNLTLVLDEPDAYLPPVGSLSLLARLLNICLERDWSLILTTHSEEMIAKAIEEDIFALARLDMNGGLVLESAHSDDSVGLTLLARPPVDRILFCEDESALHLTEALVRAGNSGLSRATAVAWGGGDGFMHQLHKHLPRPPRSPVKFAYVFDGDQRDRIPPHDSRRWGSICLPTDLDPDTLFMSAGLILDQLASRLGAPVDEVERFVDTLEGAEAHDWVNRLGGEFGRAQVLSALAGLWVASNGKEAAAWIDELLELW